MKKVLFITTHFAPDIHVGAKRLTKFAKYLPLYDWQPVIVTKEVREYHGVDVSLVQELSSELPIYRVREWRLSGVKTFLAHNKPGYANQGELAHRGFQRHFLRAANYILFYDYSWLLPAFLTARRLVRENNIQVIYSSIPNPEAHLLALLLKLTTLVKWVCEYRDPWTEQSAEFYPPVSPLQPSIEWALEGHVLRQADRLVFIGPKNQDRVLRRRPSSLASKANIINNGYDEDDFVGISHDNVDKDFCFTIGYIGTVGRWRTPEPFLRALGQALRSKPELRLHIRVRFIGEVKHDPVMAEYIPHIIEEEELNNTVVLEPFLPHRQGIRQMMQCDCLLLLQNHLPEAPDEGPQAIGVKLYEYLRAQKPILALVPLEGDAARLIHNFGAGVVVAPDNIDGIAQAILDLYDAFCQGELVMHSDLTQIQQFERRNQAKKLAEILNAVVE